MDTVRTAILTVVPFLGLMFAGATTCIAEEDSWLEEPPLNFRLTIGDVTHDIEGGKPSTVKIHGREQQIAIVAADYRTFAKGGLRFNYPASFRFRTKKLQPGEGVNYCLLVGDHVSIHIKEHATKLTFEEFADHVREKHKNLPEGIAVVAERKVDLKTSSADLEGISLQMGGAIAGQKFQQADQCFLLPSRNEENCVFLIISLKGNELTRDAVNCITMLENSLTIEENK